MLKIDRQTAIERELTKNGSVLIPNLSKQLQCSEETIRRDLKELESIGKLTRTHGGAYLMDKYDKSYPTKLRKVYYPELKSRLARQALRYVRENDVIMLDSSTTCLALAELLLSKKLNITIITNSLLVCDLCNDQVSNINLICLGGSFRSRTSSFVGYHTTDTLSGYFADRSFISCPKVTLEQGMSDNHFDESRVRENMLLHSQKEILLLDHTKFDASANLLFGNLKSIDVIITDEYLPNQWTEFCRENQIYLDYALDTGGEIPT